MSLADYFDAYSSTPAVLAVYRSEEAVADVRQNIHSSSSQPPQHRHHQHSNNHHHQHHHYQQVEIEEEEEEEEEPQPRQPSSSTSSSYAKNVSKSSSSSSSRSTSNSLRVEDRLLTAERERVSKLQARSEQLKRKEMKECTGKPKIDSRSAALAERHVNHELQQQQQHNQYQKGENQKTSGYSNKGGGGDVVTRLSSLYFEKKRQRQQEQLQKELEEKRLLEEQQQLLEEEEKKKKHKNKMMMMKANYQIGSSFDPAAEESKQHNNKRGVENMLKWKQERDRKRREAEDARLEEERRQYTGRPALNPTSVAIAHNRRVLEGTTDLDTVDDLLRRHQEHEERMKLKFEEAYPTSSASIQQQQQQQQQQHHHHVDAKAVTERLCRDAADRKERREQQKLESELMSHIDPVTGEVLFHPHTNEQYHHHHNHNHDNENENSNDENSNDDNDNSNQGREEVWERLSRPHSSSQHQHHHHNNNHHQGSSNNTSTTRDTRSPSISQYSRLLAEIHRGRSVENQTSTTAVANDDESAEAGEGKEHHQHQQTIFDRLSRPQQPHQHRYSLSRRGKSQSVENNNNHHNHHSSASTSSDSAIPEIDERSRKLDPRKNEKGMSRIESLLESEKHRQRELERLQFEQKLKQEREIEEMQHYRQNHHHHHHHHHHDDPSVAAVDSLDQEAFAERQAAWDARRKQKVLAKAARKKESETDECSFQPQIIGHFYQRPPPLASSSSSSSHSHHHHQHQQQQQHEDTFEGVPPPQSSSSSSGHHDNTPTISFSLM